MDRLRFLLIVPITIALLSPGAGVAADGADSAPGEVQDRVDEPDGTTGYPDEQQPPTGPTDPETDLDNSFPKEESVIPLGVPKQYFDLKEEIYDRIGLKLGVSYQLLYMHATERSPLASFDSGLGHWFGFTAKWTPFNRGKDFETSLVLVTGQRESLGNNAVPAEYGQVDVGSIYPVNFEFTSWPFAIEELYWEQWLWKRALFRFGVTAAAAAINPFRFKDARTSFTATPFAFHESIPAPAQGPGFAAKWWPIEDSQFYVTFVLNDVNGNPNNGWAGIDFNSLGKGELFYALEFGYKWERPGGEFDQLYVTAFYVDERSTRSPDTLPNKAGGGFKLLGSKQIGSWVGFGSYTLNTAEGGSHVAFGRHTITAGAAYLSPLGIRGEAALGLVWMDPHEDLFGSGTDLRSQFGLELYWKILLTRNMWVTPGFQFIHNPSLNPTVDDLVIPHIKFRIAF